MEDHMNLESDKYFFFLLNYDITQLNKKASGLLHYKGTALDVFTKSLFYNQGTVDLCKLYVN